MSGHDKTDNWQDMMNSLIETNDKIIAEKRRLARFDTGRNSAKRTQRLAIATKQVMTEISDQKDNVLNSNFKAKNGEYRNAGALKIFGNVTIGLTCNDQKVCKHKTFVQVFRNGQSFRIVPMHCEKCHMPWTGAQRRLCLTTERQKRELERSEKQASHPRKVFPSKIQNSIKRRFVCGRCDLSFDVTIERIGRKVSFYPPHCPQCQHKFSLRQRTLAVKDEKLSRKGITQ